MIDRHAANQVSELDPFRLQIAIVRADQRRELRTCGMAAHEHVLWIPTVFRDVVMHPAKRLGNIVEDVNHLDLGQQTIVHRYEGSA
jgi:hypothetical protein